MTPIDMELSPEENELIKAKIREKYAESRSSKNRKMLKRRIRLALLGIFALILRIGVHTKVQPIGSPSEILKYKAMMAEQAWYEHPAFQFVLCGLIAPLPLMAIVAAEAKGNINLFFVKLANAYGVFLRGLFTISVLVDIIQVLLRSAPPITLFSAISNLCHGFDWIDPYIRNDRLSFPSYQATITAYTTCYTLMVVNKSFIYQLAKRPFSKFLLRILITSFVVVNVVLLSFPCYEAYISSGQAVELYYISVLLGIASAIFEVQGIKDWQSQILHYHVLFRKMSRNAPSDPQKDCKMKSPEKSLDKIVIVAMQCLRAYQASMKQKPESVAFKEMGETIKKLVEKEVV